MRSMRISVLTMLAGLIACPVWAQPTTPGAAPPGGSSPPKATTPSNESPKTAPVAKPPAGSLEELLATALRNNPDIRVAEAKLREAEANLNKARIQVMQQVVSLKNAVDAQKKAAEVAEQSHKRIQELKKSNVVPEAEVTQSEALLAKAKADLAKLEADLAIPLGRLPGKYDTVDGGSNTIFQGLSRNDAIWLDWSNTLNLNASNNPWTYPQATYPGQWTPQAQWQLNNLGSGNVTNPYQIPSTIRTVVNLPADYSGTTKAAAGSVADKIRTALDKPIKIEWKQPMPLNDVIEFLRSKAEIDVPFRILLDNDAKSRIDLMTGELPLGAWLQAVEDSIPQLIIVVRDYGLVVTTRGRLPQDAEPVRSFWQRSKAQQKATTAKEPERVTAPPKAK
ncbi:MAG TPA: hypothetical protein VKS79_12340 [Gemmataceae bacterium]|nr:hypothetical protein [Gemmataceae bacterium]